MSYDFKGGIVDEENNNEYIPYDKKSYFTFGNGDGRTEYKEVKNLHIGQLKLFLSEMQAIVYHIDISKINNILYIGAAHGFHINLLSKLFPLMKFHLYDYSKNWDKRLFLNKNIKIYNKYFGENELNEWKNFKENIFLISDIRSLNVEYNDNRYLLEQKDMDLQKRWVEELKPCISLLKFKLPYISDVKTNTKNYLDGELYRQIYQKQSSTETRLLVKAITYRDWDLKIYEEMNAYHNQIIRKKYKFINPIDGTKKEIYPDKGLYNDYESTTFTIIVIDYLKKINKLVNEKNIKLLIDKILKECYYNEIDLILKKNLN